jgi:hypothetical protein
MTIPPAPTPDQEKPGDSSAHGGAPYDPWQPTVAEDLGFDEFNEAATTPTPIVKPAWKSWPLERSPEHSRSGDIMPSRGEFVPLLVGAGIVVVLVSVLASVLLVSVFGNVLHGPNLAVARPTQAAVTPTATATPRPTATPLPPTVAAFVGQNTTAQGTWQGAYGSQGNVVVGDTPQVPPTIQVTPQNVGGFVWAPSTPDPRALQKATNPADRIAACWYSGASFTIDIVITDGQPHQLALYLLDWDRQGRVETVTMFDPTTRIVVDTRGVSAFGDGVYLIWRVHDHVVLQVTNAPGSINAVVNGLFFAPA